MNADLIGDRIEDRIRYIESLSRRERIAYLASCESTVESIKHRLNMEKIKIMDGDAEQHPRWEAQAAYKQSGEEVVIRYLDELLATELEEFKQQRHRDLLNLRQSAQSKELDAYKTAVAAIRAQQGKWLSAAHVSAALSVLDSTLAEISKQTNEELHD